MAKKKIAVIEDDHAIQQMYRFRLEQEGYDVYVANNGIEGLDLINIHKPDLVLLDIKMPQMSGDEMLHKLRSTDEGSKIKVFILTNVSRDEVPASLRLLRVDRYIVKAHHTPRQITSMIQEFFDSRHPADIQQ